MGKKHVAKNIALTRVKYQMFQRTVVNGCKLKVIYSRLADVLITDKLHIVRAKIGKIAPSNVLWKKYCTT